MAVTIDDIANEARVSAATVSRVINGSKSVSPELKKRVKEAIERNHFRPNSFAKSLATDTSNMIGVIVSDISNSVISALIKGVNDVCQTKGLTVMICESNGDAETEKMLLNRLQEQRVSGVLLAGVNIDAEQTTAMLDLDYPIVLVTQQTSDGQAAINTVVHDNRQLVIDAMTFLTANGHKKIAFIGGPQNDFSSGKLRLEGFLDAVAQYELDIPESFIAHADFSYEGGMNAMQRIYEESVVLPTAVLASSDVMAAGAVSCIRRLGMKVPNDLSVMGIDDTELATYLHPALSTVRIPYFEEGKRAAEELFALIESGEKTTGRLIRMPHKIIRRFSVKNIG